MSFVRSLFFFFFENMSCILFDLKGIFSVAIIRRSQSYSLFATFCVVSLLQHAEVRFIATIHFIDIRRAPPSTANDMKKNEFFNRVPEYRIVGSFCIRGYTEEKTHLLPPIDRLGFQTFSVESGVGDDRDCESRQKKT